MNRETRDGGTGRLAGSIVALAFLCSVAAVVLWGVDPGNDQQPDDTALPKFDVFYAWSSDHGVNWGYAELYADPAEPALDWAREDVDPHEYNGIAWYDDSVWTTYAGTWQDDPQGNQAVISASRIDW